MNIQFSKIFKIYTPQILLIGLIIFPDISVKTYFAISRDLYLHPYLHRIYYLTLADLCLVYMMLIILLDFNKIVPALNSTKYLLYIYTFYIVLGCLQLNFGYASTKTILYDIKSISYFLIPYLLLRINGYDSLTNILKYLPLLLMLGVACDSIYMNTFWGSEYGHSLGFPAYIEATLFCVALGYFVYRPSILTLCILLIEVFGAINRISLGYIYLMILSVPLLLINRVFSRKSIFIFLILFITIFLFIIPIFMSHDIFGILKVKADSLNIRIIQFREFLDNSTRFPTIIIGNGMGSLWDYSNLALSKDAYSVGNSMSFNSELVESMESTKRFIFNFGPAALLYKFGILGLCLITNWIAITSKLNGNFKINKNILLYRYLVIYFGIYSLISIGTLKHELLFGLFLYAYESETSALKA